MSHSPEPSGRWSAYQREHRSRTGARFENSWSWRVLAIRSVYLVPLWQSLFAPHCVRWSQWETFLKGYGSEVLYIQESCHSQWTENGSPHVNWYKEQLVAEVGDLILGHSHKINPIMTEGLLSRVYTCEKYWDAVLGASLASLTVPCCNRLMCVTCGHLME